MSDMLENMQNLFGKYGLSKRKLLFFDSSLEFWFLRGVPIRSLKDLLGFIRDVAAPGHRCHTA